MAELNGKEILFPIIQGPKGDPGQGVEVDEAGNTYIYSTDRLRRIALLVGDDDFFQVQVRESLDDNFSTCMYYEIAEGRFRVHAFDSKDDNVNLFEVDRDALSQWVAGVLTFQVDADGVFHKGEEMAKQKAVDKVELKAKTNQLEITNLKNALYGSVLSLETDSNADLDKAILSDSVSVNEQVYPIVDNTRALLSEVSGKTVKFNQLLDRSKYPATSTNNGITFTNNGDGTITVNGTATNSSYFHFVPTSLRQSFTVGHKYLVKGCPPNGGTESYKITFQVRVNGSISSKFDDYGTGVIANLFVTSYDEVRVTISINNGTTVENLVFKPQLYDLTAMGLDHITTVEEFNALFPEEMYEYDSGSLKTAEIESVKMTGKNLLNKPYFHTLPRTHNGITYTEQSDGVILVNGTATASSYCIFKDYTEETLPKGTYTIQGGTENVLLTVQRGTTKAIWDYIANSNESFDATFSGGVEIYRLTLKINEGTTVNNVTIYPMLQAGTVATEYEPYQEVEITLPSKQTLNGVNNIKDKLVVTKNEDNYYTLKKIVNVGKVVLDGSIGGYNSVDVWYFIGLNGLGISTLPQSKTDIISDRFETIDITNNRTSSGICFNSTTQTTHIVLRKQEFTTAEEYSTYLSSNNVTIYYPLATPTEEIISSTLTLEQVSAMRRNGGLIEVVGNDNAEYSAKPTVDLTVICEKPSI